MRAVVQRVSKASVAIDGKITGQIKHGLLIFVGIEDADNADDIEWMSSKLISLRIFGDDAGKMNLSIQDINGDILLISQFTLFASTQKGNRPSFIKAAKPQKAIPIYENLIHQLALRLGKKIATGSFGADMKVELLNDGPVTILIDTKNKE
jgi:D-tyrosyl-tRNA(Tyr) deacylase